MSLAASMPLSVDLVTYAALVVTLAYVIFGLTGFGSSIFAVPLLAQVLPLRFAVPTMILLDLGASLLVGARNRAAANRPELTRLIPFMLVGMAIGAALLVHAPERALLFALGCFVLANALWSLFFQPRPEPIAAGWSVPLGTLGGMFGALFGTGGPIYTIYLARRLDDKNALRATLSIMVLLSALSRLVIFATAGLYAQDNLLWLAALLVPTALLGLFVGSRLHHRVPTRRVVQAVWGILVFGGASLIWRGVGG